MMQAIELKPDVVEFLENTTTTQYSMGVKSYIVNGTVYTETDEKGIYLVQFLNG